MSKEVLKLALARLQARTDTADLNAIAALNEALAEQPAQPQQEPVAEVQFKMTGGNAGIAKVIREICDPHRKSLQPGDMLYTSPQRQRKPLTDQVLVPLDVLEAAEISLCIFCSDQGWSANDMQTMDNLSAYIAKHKAAHGIK